MNRLLFAAVLLAGTALAAMPAQAGVVLSNHLSGTGDNVIFDSFNNSNLAVGSFNGQHTGFVDFTCLGGCTGFTGSANGNDIKIANTNNLQIQVFDAQGHPLGTTTDVFSLKGTGSVTASVFAVTAGGVPENAQNFNLGPISLTAQSGFTFDTIDGEVISRIVLLDVGGNITEFEHYRIDAAVLPTPIPSAAALFLSGVVGLSMLARRRKNKTLAA